MAKILIIDESESVREMIIMVLNNFGYKPVIIPDRDNLPYHLSSIAPQLVLLDVRPGGVPGPELCQQIKAASATLPIILMSTNSNLLSSNDSCQVNDTIEKPFDILEFKNKIDKVLSDTDGLILEFGKMN